MMTSAEKTSALVNLESRARVVPDYVMECLLAYITHDTVLLAHESAEFLTYLEDIWEGQNISWQDVRRELLARIDLSDDLLRRKIRARKGGQYRSTKLP